MDQKLVLERGDGWPRKAARVWLFLGIALLAGSAGGAAYGGSLTNGLEGVAWAGSLCLVLALVLRCWRRGVTMRQDNQSLSRWWGLALPFGSTWVVRELDRRSFADYPCLLVEPVPAHYKKWSEMHRVVLVRPEQLDRLVVDDEFPDVARARAQAEKVADFLQSQGFVAEILHHQ